MVDLVDELERHEDEILHELTIVETKKGNMYVIFPEDQPIESPIQIEKIGRLLCQLIINWVLKLSDAVTFLHAQLEEKERRVIPVSVMPKNIKL